MCHCSQWHYNLNLLPLLPVCYAGINILNNVNINIIQAHEDLRDYNI